MAGRRDFALTGCHAVVEPTNPRLPGTGLARASGAMWLLSAVVKEVCVQAAIRGAEADKDPLDVWRLTGSWFRSLLPAD